MLGVVLGTTRVAAVGIGVAAGAAVIFAAALGSEVVAAGLVGVPALPEGLSGVVLDAGAVCALVEVVPSSARAGEHKVHSVNIEIRTRKLVTSSTSIYGGTVMMMVCQFIRPENDSNCQR